MSEDTHSDTDVSDHNDDVDAALIGGTLGVMWANDEPGRAAPAKPYVEPDYGAVWARRWLWIMVVLIVLAGTGVTFLFWLSRR